MKKHSFAFIAISFTLIAALCIALSYQLALGGLRENMQRRAFTELNFSTTSQAAYLQRTIELQYAPLESLAAYLSVCEGDPQEAFIEHYADNNAQVLANRLCMLGYADLEGNAVSYEGASLGNIADRAYFQDAIFWKGEYSIEYMASTALTPDPRILFGVPVLKNNDLVGILFCAKEIEIFERSIFANGFDGNEITVITDGTGAIIATGGNSVGRFSASSLLEEYTTDTIVSGITAEGLVANMRASQSGYFTANCADEEYVYYTPLGVNDWYIWGITPSSATQTSYTANVRNYMRGVYVFAAFYVLTLVAAFFVLGRHSRAIKRDRAIINQQAERYETILHEMNASVYEYNIATQKLKVSDAFERQFGYALLENWTEEVKTNAAKHPEIDYAGIMEAKARVEMSGEPTDVIIHAQTSRFGLRWFHISMSPLFDENRHMLSIYGLISDITDEHEEGKQQALDRERLITAVEALSSLITFSNLTRNSYSVIGRRDLSTYNIDRQGIFDELVEHYAALVSEADRKRFLDTFSREKLLEAFAAGKTQVEMDYCQTDADGVSRWLRMQVIRVDNPYDDDVLEIAILRNIDEQMAYQALLQRTYDLTIENMPCFVAKWMFADGDVLLVEANKGYLDFMKISESDAYYRSIVYCFSDQEKAELINMLYECERDRREISFSKRACKANGEECYIQVQASFFEERDGNSVYYGTLTDITELVMTQNELLSKVDALKEANAQLAANSAYRDLLNSSVDGGMMVYSAWNGSMPMLQYVSPGLLNTLGYTLAEFEAGFANNIKTFIHPSDFKLVEETNRRHVSLGDHFSMEYRIRHKDGRYIWLIEHSQVVESVDGSSAFSVAALLTNITQQKKLEQRLRISEAEYKIAADLSNHAVLTFDIASRSFSVISQGLSAVNFEAATGVIPDTLIQGGHIAPESVDAIKALFDGICNGEQREKTVLAVNTCEDGKHWLEARYSLTHDDAGNPVAAVMSLEDITDRKRTEWMFNVSNTFLYYAKKATKLMVFNLSAGTLEYETEGPHGLLSQNAGSSDVHAIITYITEQTVYADDVEAFTQFFVPEHFVAAFQNEVFDESFEYRGLTAAGIPHWMNVQTRMVEDSVSKDVLLYVVFSDVHEQKLMELALLRIQQENRPKANRKVFARTFGYFDLFVDGAPLHFTNPKEKELLALLIDRNGGTLGANEAIAYLWEDEPAGDRQNTRYRKLAMNLKNTLQNAGVGDILVVNRGIRSIDTTKLECDYYQFLKGDPEFRQLYHGAYMTNYSWSESTVSVLDDML